MVTSMKAPFQPCTLNAPKNIKKRRLELGPTIPTPLLFVLIAAILLLCTQFHSFWLARFRDVVLDDTVIMDHPHHANQSEFAIFYHIFVPQEEPEQSNALRIIDEQMHQIAKSYAASSNSNYRAKPNKLYYNTLGAPNVVNETYMARYCDKLLHFLECEHLHHFDKGTEELTLTGVHQHCSQQPESEWNRNAMDDNNKEKTSTTKVERDARRVVYMHNKGSFHEHPFNEQWRRLMTYSVTSEECLHPSDGTCNLCGLYFVAERGFFMPGNFWTARCDYVERLKEPKRFAVRSTEVMKEALLMNLKHEFDFDMYAFADENYGVDRYADELWVGGHPSIQPCDLSMGKQENFGTGYGDPFFEWVLSIWDPFQVTFRTLNWSMAPSLPLKIPKMLREGKPWGFGKKIDWMLDFFVLFDTPKTKEDRVKKRLREFTYLSGNLFKWIHIYGQVPPPESWIWSWFPDGEKWRKAIEEHGNMAVETMAKENYQSVNDESYVDPFFHKRWRRKLS